MQHDFMPKKTKKDQMKEAVVGEMEQYMNFVTEIA